MVVQLPLRSSPGDALNAPAVCANAGALNNSMKMIDPSVFAGLTFYTSGRVILLRFLDERRLVAVCFRQDDITTRPLRTIQKFFREQVDRFGATIRRLMK